MSIRQKVIVRRGIAGSLGVRHVVTSHRIDVRELVTSVWCDAGPSVDRPVAVLESGDLFPVCASIYFR